MINFLDPSVPGWDLKLKVNGRILYVHGQILCTFSNFFRVMLNSNFSERFEDVIELKDVVFEEFHKFLEVIYCPSYHLRRGEVDYLFVLADRFDASVVLDKCEEYLMGNLVELETTDFWTYTYNLLNNKSICIENVSFPINRNTVKRRRVLKKYHVKTGPLQWEVVMQSKKKELILVFSCDLSDMNPQKYWEISLEVMICLSTAEGHSCLSTVLTKESLVGGETNNHKCEFTHNLCSLSKLLMFYESTFTTSSLVLDIELSVVSCNAFRKVEFFDFHQPASENVDTTIELGSHSLYVHSQILQVCLPNLAKFMEVEGNKKIIKIGTDRELTKYLPYILHYIYCRGSWKSMFDNFLISQRVESLAFRLGLRNSSHYALYAS